MTVRMPDILFDHLLRIWHLHFSLCQYFLKLPAPHACQFRSATRRHFPSAVEADRQFQHQLRFRMFAILEELVTDVIQKLQGHTQGVSLASSPPRDMAAFFRFRSRR